MSTTTDRPQRIRALTLARKMTLTDDERRELAAVLTGHEGSWRTISEEDARRVADALHAFAYVQHLLNERRRRPTL